MTTVTRPRGPLPARVYWVRRLLLLAVALLLVFGVAHLLGSGGGSDGPSATPVGADVSQTAGSTSASPSAKASPGTKGTKGASPSATPLAEPDGPCSGSDVVVTPGVRGAAYAGSTVVFDLSLTTEESPACTWVVSPRSLVLKLTSGSDRIWSTQDCKGAVRKQQVVVRKDVPTTVSVAWRGQRSDGTCSRTTDWAQPGFYHVTTAAIGAEPQDEQFELREPVAVTITPSPSPTPSDDATGKGDEGEKDRKSDGPSPSPSGSPSASD